MNLPDNAEQAARVIESAKQAGVRFVNLQFSDIFGAVKNVTIPLSLFGEAVAHGKWFDGSAIEGFARVAESDMYLRPDLDTFAVLPWSSGEGSTARVLCWVTTPAGDLFRGDPRVALKRAQDYAASLGYRYNIGPELEFFLFRLEEDGRIEKLPHDRASYFGYSTGRTAEIRKEMVRALQAQGIDVETDHHEVASGQHEIDFNYNEALRTADTIFASKYTLKAVALQHRLHVTFMPKPIHGIPGSGLHCHQSLFGLDGANLFADETDEYGLSETAKHFIAGQLAHAKSMSAILSPLVNSYKRLVAGFEAPVFISWARFNRSSLIRVPRIRPGDLDSTRIELRCPDPSCNPYLAFAVMLHCGLDGIRRKLSLPEAVEEHIRPFDEGEMRRRNIGVLPSTLGQALEALEQDDVVRDALGDDILEPFLEAKRREWDDYRTNVTQWEVDQYLEVY